MKTPFIDAVASRRPIQHRKLPRQSRLERGYIMVISMLILLLITILSISMAKSFFVEEEMGGNMREKNRSFVAAQSALAYGEWYVRQGIESLGGNAFCPTGVLTASTVICPTQQTPNTPPYSTANMPLTTYLPLPLPATSTTVPFLNTSSTGGKDTFYAAPGVYIQYVGETNGSFFVYQITAFGFGGTPDAVSIVQSVFQVAPNALGLSTGGSN
jgi:type IV pilus assembly protein PilX